MPSMAVNSMAGAGPVHLGNSGACAGAKMRISKVTPPASATVPDRQRGSAIRPNARLVLAAG